MARRVRMMLLLLVLGLTVSSCSGPAHNEAPADQPPSIWVITGGWFDRLRYEDQALANRLFRRSPSRIVGTYHHRSAVVGGQTPKSFATSFAYASFEDFNDGARYGALHGLNAVMYDPEGWAATPLVEQRDPARYFARFASLARRGVETVIITPHPNLMNVPGARCGSDNGESVYEAYIRCGVMGAAARHADIVEVQAQQLQGQPEEYRRFVGEATGQARAANEEVKVIAGLTTFRATPEQMFQAWSAVRDVVDGYYLSIRDDREVGTALDFLRLLPEP